MLQQTRVDTVIPYFERFMARFPTPLALAEASEDEALSAWSGLGYYRRARMLRAGARQVAEGTMPRDRTGLLALPGVGRYTAGAIASIAYGQVVGLVDGNVARVLARLFAIEEDIARAGLRRAESIADELVSRTDPGSFNQALMELGATVCTPRAPACALCPVAFACRARAEGRVDELPRTSGKARPKPVRVQALVATKGDRVLLARRRSGGLFGGLWEAPSVTGGARAAKALCASLHVVKATRRGSVAHVLSHRRLTVDVYVGTLAADPPKAALPEVYEAADLFDARALDRLGIATLTRKVLGLAEGAFVDGA